MQKVEGSNPFSRSPRSRSTLAQRAVGRTPPGRWIAALAAGMVLLVVATVAESSAAARADDDSPDEAGNVSGWTLMSLPGLCCFGAG
jgi:hypothetical protein